MHKLERTLKTIFCFLALCAPAHGQDWNQVTTSANIWYSMAGSQHGSNLVAADYTDDPIGYLIPGQIYASTNGGQTWSTTSAPSNFWASVASSTNGMRLIAGAFDDSTGYNPGQIFISSDGGLTWTNSSAPAKHWNAVGSSADGRILVGAANNDSIYVSTNSGTNWIQSNAPNNRWQAVAVSADGVNMYATENIQTTEGISGVGGIFISTNSGSTWNLSDSAPPLGWNPIICSGDGKRVFAAVIANYGGGIYTSTNAGTTWNQTSAPTNNWQCLAMSTYGDVLLAGVDSGDNTTGQIYLSTDGGSTWIPQTAPRSSWGCVFCSADGSLLTAGENENGSYIYSASNPILEPNLSIKVTSNQAVLSWPIFPAGFQPQTTSTLNASENWTNTSNAVIISGTNNFMTNNLVSHGAFFRLARP